MNSTSHYNVWALPWIRRLVAGLSSRRPASRCGICDWWNSTDRSLSPSISSFPGQYHSTYTQHSFILIFPTLHTLRANPSCCAV